MACDWCQDYCLRGFGAKSLPVFRSVLMMQVAGFCLSLAERDEALPIMESNINIDFGIYEKSILAIRERPEYADLVKWAYFDEDIVEAATRFSLSFEAAQIIWEIDHLLGVNSKEERHNFHVADVGGGRGIVSYTLSSAGYKVSLLDIDESDVCGTGAAKRLLKETKANVEVLTVDIAHYEERFGCYDVVFCKQVLHHAVDLNRMVMGMSKLARLGGWVYAFKEHIIRTRKDLPIFLRNHPLSEFNTYESAFTRSMYMDAFRKAGLKNIRCWIAASTPVPKGFHSTINGENKRMPAKGVMAKLIQRLLFYYPFPGMEFSFIGRKPGVVSK